MKLFNLDSPFMQGLGKLADLMILNIITLICCLPVVTIGASITALYYMALKIVRNEEVYIIKGFLKAFRQNLKQSTIVWLIQIVVMIILAMDAYLIFWNPDMKMPMAFQIVMMVGAILIIALFMFIYPVMSKFENSLKQTFKNAFLMSIMQMPKIFLMAVFWLTPLAIAIFAIQFLPLSVLFGFSLPAYGSALLYNKFFKKMENTMIERAKAAGEAVADPGEEDEHIFSDELDPALADKAEVQPKA